MNKKSKKLDEITDGDPIKGFYMYKL